MPDTNYSLEAEAPTATLKLPAYNYHPAFPGTYRPKIGLIGCGGITEQHLAAYRSAGLDVVALVSAEKGTPVQAEGAKDIPRA